MSPTHLSQSVSEQLNEILAESPAAVVIENGEVLFDFSSAKFS